MSFQKCKIAATGVNPRKYHGAPRAAEKGSRNFVMSSTEIRRFGERVPLYWLKSKPKPDTTWTRYGQLFESLVIPTALFDEQFIVRPATYQKHVLKCPHCGSITSSKKCRDCKIDRVEAVVEEEWSERSETCQQWVKDAEAEGLQVIEEDGTEKSPGLTQAREAAAIFLSVEGIRNFIASSDLQVELTGEWRDQATGRVVPCRCLIDVAPRDNTEFAAWLGDIKTTRTGYNPFFAADVRDRGYDVQAAWNLDMFNAATGQNRRFFRLLTSDNTPPYLPGQKVLTDGDAGTLEPGKVDTGRVIYQAGMRWYCECLETGQWPGYDDCQGSYCGMTEIKRDKFKDGDREQRAIDRAPEETMPKMKKKTEGEL